jgi:hypothetical protein
MFISSPPVKNEIPILIHGNGIRRTTFQTLPIIMSPQREIRTHIHQINLYDTINHRNKIFTLTETQTTDPLTYRNRSSPRSARSRRFHRRRRPQMPLKTPNQSLGQYKSCRIPTISPRLTPRGIAGKLYGEMRARSGSCCLLVPRGREEKLKRETWRLEKCGGQPRCTSLITCSSSSSPPPPASIAVGGRSAGGPLSP